MSDQKPYRLELFHMEFADVGNPSYIALETFRKSGEGVSTPVWVCAEDGKLYVWTQADSGKVKRIRNSSRVRIAVSDARGTPKSEWVEARARVLDSAEEDESQRRRLQAKYGMQYRLFSMMNGLRGSKAAHVTLELTPP
jgi:hypothetical protein